MKTITMYELLGMVKDGKAPKKFIYDNQLFILDEEDNVYRSQLGNRFGAMYQLDIKLNDEIEILEGTLEEEKKIPEKLDYLGLKIREGNLSKQDVIMLCDYIDYQTQTINLLIDYLKSKGE